MTPVIAAVFAILASTSATGAHARRTSDCLWAAMPRDVRTTLTNQFAQGSLSLAIVTSAQAETASRACQVPLTEAGAVLTGDALRGHAVMDFALAGFAEQKVAASRLDAAWKLLGPQTRESFSRAFSAGFKPSDAAMDEVAAAAANAGLEGDGMALLFFDYVSARAVLQRID